MQTDIRAFAPEAVVTIDSPGLFLRLARGVRTTAPVLHWVAPQVWAWRSGRALRVTRSIDTLCCLMPFEPGWFSAGPARVVFTGHPAAARIGSGSPEDPPVIALLPGSRPQEIARHWPLFRSIAGLIRRRAPRVRFRVGCAPGLDPALFGGLGADVRTGISLHGASAALVASGTATIEAAAHGVPQVVVYAVNPATWAMGRRLVRGVDHLALVNVLAGREVIPEHVQEIDPGAVATDVLALLGPAGDAQVQAAEPWLASLRPEGAIERVADEVQRLLRRQPAAMSSILAASTKSL